MKLTIALLVMAATAVNGFATFRTTAPTNRNGLVKTTTTTSTSTTTARSTYYMQLHNKQGSTNNNSSSSSNININTSPTAPMSVAFKNAMAALMCAFSLMAFPSDSFAASSGGRIGGSSFRAPSSSFRAPSSSYRAPSSSYRAPSSTTRMNAVVGGGGNYRPSPTYVSVPAPIIYNRSPDVAVLAQCVNSPDELYGSIFTPKELLFTIGFAFAFSCFLDIIIGSDVFTRYLSFWLDSSVIKLQISMDADWAKKGNIMQRLADLSSRRGAVKGRSKISALASDAASALQDTYSRQWNSASFSGQAFFGGKAKSYFDNLAVAERTKFDRKTSGARGSTFIPIGRPTQVVVTLIVAMRGKSKSLAKDGVLSVSDVEDVLRILKSEPEMFGGANIMGVELLWTPSEAGDVLTEREVVEDFPELIRLDY